MEPGRIVTEQITTGQLTDEELARQAAAGDTGAFEQLVERHQRYVFNLCIRSLANYYLAAEVAQESFLRAWRSLGSFRGDARFTTWLYTIAHNLCINRMQGIERDARHRIGEDEAAEELAGIHSKEEDPAVQYEKRERREWVHRQIEGLPARYRTVITLFYLQELSYQEIAEVTGMPIGTVKTHLFRAKNMLRRSLEDGMPGESFPADGIREGRSEGPGASGPGRAPGLLCSLPTGAG